MLEQMEDPAVKVSVSIRRAHKEALEADAEEAGIKVSQQLQLVLEQHYAKREGEHWRFTWLPRKRRELDLRAERKQELIAQVAAEQVA